MTTAPATGRPSPGACAAVAVLLYSQFLTRHEDIPGRFARRTYLAAASTRPTKCTLGTSTSASSPGRRQAVDLAGTLVLVLAAIGGAAAWLRPVAAPTQAPTRASAAAQAPRQSAVQVQPITAFWGRYLAANAAIAMALFSAIPYTTPWNLLPFHAATVVVAGLGVAALAGLSARRATPALVAAIVAIGAVHLGWQACGRRSCTRPTRAIRRSIHRPSRRGPHGGRIRDWRRCMATARTCWCR